MNYISQAAAAQDARDAKEDLIINSMHALEEEGGAQRSGVSCFGRIKTFEEFTLAPLISSP